MGCGGQVVHLVQGAGEAVEQRHSVGVKAGFPRCDRDDNPEVSKREGERVQVLKCCLKE